MGNRLLYWQTLEVADGSMFWEVVSNHLHLGDISVKSKSNDIRFFDEEGGCVAMHDRDGVTTLRVGGHDRQTDGWIDHGRCDLQYMLLAISTNFHVIKVSGEYMKANVLSMLGSGLAFHSNAFESEKEAFGPLGL